MLNELRGHPFPTQVSEAWIRGRARGQRKLDPEDFPVLKEAALDTMSDRSPTADQLLRRFQEAADRCNAHAAEISRSDAEGAWTA